MPLEQSSSTLWYVRSDSLGEDRDIGTRLIQSFFNTIAERIDGKPSFAFVNRGVFLALDDSPVLEALLALEGEGSIFYSCGTCLDYYGARERLAVGSVGSMALLQKLMCRSDRVITL